MDLSRTEIRPLVKFQSLLKALIQRIQDVEFLDEDGVFRASLGEKVWYIPSKDRIQFTWAINFIDNHERYLDVLRKGDIIIEVGAATGEYTIPAAKHIGDTGEIHAFEVEPMSYLCLKKNLALYNIKNVTPVQEAMSNESGKTLTLSFERGGLSSGSFHDELSEKLRVKTISCDDYARSKGLKKIDVLKATVNGHEPAVMRGALSILETVRVVIFQSAKHEEVIAILSEVGFTVKKVVDTDVKEVKIILMEKKPITLRENIYNNK